MGFIHALAACAHAHLHAILVAVAAWAFVGKLLDAKWPMPPATAPRWKRALHFILVNLPSFAIARLDGQRFKLLGFDFPINFPIVGWTARDTSSATRLEIPKGPAALLPLFALPLLLSSCSPTQAYIGALKFETGAATVLDDARDLWHKFDAAHQQAIVDGATSLAAGQQELASWRVDRNRVDAAFVAAREAIAALADALNAAGAMRQQSYGTALADVAGAIGQLTRLLAQYGVKLPSLPSVIEMRLIAPDIMVAVVIVGGVA